MKVVLRMTSNLKSISRLRNPKLGENKIKLIKTKGVKETRQKMKASTFLIVYARGKDTWIATIVLKEN